MEHEGKSTVMVRVRVSPEMEPQSGHAMPSRIPAAVARSG